MNEREFENKIKDALKINTYPDRESFKLFISSLETRDVTKNESMRYNTQTATSNIINNKFADIITVWKSKRIILIPSFLVLLFVSAFALSSHSKNSSSEILKIAEQNENLEESEIYEDEDQVILTNFDTSDIDNVSNITNEIKS